MIALHRENATVLTSAPPPPLHCVTFAPLPFIATPQPVRSHSHLQQIGRRRSIAWFVERQVSDFMSAKKHSVATIVLILVHVFSYCCPIVSAYQVAADLFSKNKCFSIYLLS